MSAPEIRRATDDDVPALARTLTRAFAEDPVVGWAWPAHARRERALEHFQATRLRQLIAGGEVWTTPELDCAALWALPGRWQPSVRETLEVFPAFAHPSLVWRMPLVMAGWLNVERRHPREPLHYYLAVLGTDPPAQGQGLGTRVLAPVLEECDREGVAAFLESSKESNIAFYARHGFRVVQEMRLPRGPLIWKMWREPLGGAAS